MPDALLQQVKGCRMENTGISECVTRRSSLRWVGRELRVSFEQERRNKGKQEEIMNPDVMRSAGCSAALAMTALLFTPAARCGAQTKAEEQSVLPPPVELTAQQDHQRIMDLLHISSLRPGANGSN